MNAPRQLQLAPSSRPTRVSQATTVEQSRAIAEVQAAVVVAQNCPRDMRRAEADMRDVCGRMSMAKFAFYAVRNRGNGPSVHLMRELARIWGNVQYGVQELNRSDELGESEVQAWAWDVQTNTRSSRTFIVPHARMANGSRQQLVDLQDIYLNNQNIGARAVRECIETILPRWFTQEAQDICHRTLEEGEGVPLAQRIEIMIGHFKAIGVTARQIEDKLGKSRGTWDGGDVAQMGIVYTSITQEGLRTSDVFEPDPGLNTATLPAAAEQERPKVRTQSAQQQPETKPADTSPPEPPPPNEPPAEDPNADPATLEPEAPAPEAPPEPQAKPEKVGGKRVAEILALLNKTQDFGNDAEARKGRLDWLSAWAERRIDSINNLSAAEADDLLAQLTREAEAMK